MFITCDERSIFEILQNKSWPRNTIGPRSLAHFYKASYISNKNELDFLDKEQTQITLQLMMFTCTIFLLKSFVIKSSSSCTGNACYFPSNFLQLRQNLWCLFNSSDHPIRPNVKFWFLEFHFALASHQQFYTFFKPMILLVYLFVFKC